MTENTVENRSVHDILEQGGAAASKIVNSYLDELDSLKQKNTLADGGYKADLTDEQRKQILSREKLEQAQAAHADVKQDYTNHLANTHWALGRRREELREDLYSIGNPELLVRATLASDEELRNLTAVGAQTGESGSDLIKACLVAAERREAGDILNTIFQSRPDLGEAYQEWSALPPAEVLERQIENVDKILPEPTPDRLTARPIVSPY